MTKSLLLVGSPRGIKSTSTIVGEYLMNLLREKELETDTLWLIKQFSSKEKMNQVLEAIDKADIVILAAPLYDDCQPFIVAKTMEAIASSGKSMKKKRLFIIKNSGFGETIHITAVSLSIYKKFAESVGFKWAGSLAIGGGEMFRGAHGKKLDDSGIFAKRLKRSLGNIAEDLENKKSYPDETFEIPRIFKSKLFMWIGNQRWKSGAKKNKAIIDARPYES